MKSFSAILASLAGFTAALSVSAPESCVRIQDIYT